MNIKILHKNNKYFPKNFLKLKDCPEFIFVLGNEKILNDFSIAIVGARKASYESKAIAKTIAEDIATSDVAVVSGLAIGIDSEAHAGASKAQGKTIAVLGNGLDKIYPKENQKIAMQIVENGGAIISEQFPGVDPLPINLNKRNRLISALAEGVLIIEAKRKSGSLITAEYAKKQEKKLFVIPGNINDMNFEGSNQLLVDGAGCVRNAKDMLKNYDIKIKENASQNSLKKIPENLVSIYNLINKKGTSFQEICTKSSEVAKDIFTKLTMLEVSGHVKKADGKFFKT